MNNHHDSHMTCDRHRIRYLEWDKDGNANNMCPYCAEEIRAEKQILTEIERNIFDRMIWSALNPIYEAIHRVWSTVSAKHRLKRDKARWKEYGHDFSLANTKPIHKCDECGIGFPVLKIYLRGSDRRRTIWCERCAYQMSVPCSGCETPVFVASNIKGRPWCSICHERHISKLTEKVREEIANRPPKLKPFRPPRLKKYDL